MTITAIRYRTEGALVVLQVAEKIERDGPYSYSEGPKWRDAKVEDMLDVAGHVTKERVVYVPSGPCGNAIDGARECEFGRG